MGDIFPILDRPRLVKRIVKKRGNTNVTQFRDEAEAPPRELYPVKYDEIYDKSRFPPMSTPEAKKMIRLFWWCSTTGNWDWFDFDKAFEATKKTLEFWVYNNFGAYAGDLNEDFSNWKEVIKRAEEDEARWWEDISAIDSRVRMVVKDYVDLHRRLVNYAHDYDLEGKISFFDEIIHIEHLGGNLYNIRDMDKLREEFEERYL